MKVKKSGAGNFPLRFLYFINYSFRNRSFSEIHNIMRISDWNNPSYSFLHFHSFYKINNGLIIMLDKKSSGEFLNLITILLCLLTIYVHFSDSIFGYNFVHYSEHSIISSFVEDENLGKASWQIIVDLDQLSLFVYKNGTLIKTYPCSGGKDETPSPTGEFKIISKESWGEGFGGIWMGLNVPWGSFGIHGTRNPSIIGKKNVSKGCIRMLTENAKELAALVPLETPVKIVQENRPFFTRYLGDTGSEIWNSQVILNNLGYYDGDFDGKFGNQLRESIIEFQKDNGLKETGSLNTKTYNKILMYQNI